MAQEATLVKTPYKRTVFTDEQLREFMACADPVTGPQYFMDNFFYIQHPTRGKMLYHPFDYQKRLIDTYHNYRFSISMMCNVKSVRSLRCPYSLLITGSISFFSSVLALLRR